MRSIFNLGSSDKLLVFLAQEIIRSVSGNESSSAKRNIHLLTSSIIIAKSLTSASWNLDSHEGSDFRRIERIKCSVDVPSVESSCVKIVFLGDSSLVEHLVVWMFQCNVLQSLIFLVESITNNLHLWLFRDGLEVRVEDGAFRIESLAVAIAVSCWVEAASEFILGFLTSSVISNCSA